VDAPHKTLTLRELGRELAEEFLSLDRGLPYTFARLLADPGGTIRRYVEARDPRITKPVRYFLIASAVLAATLYALRPRLEQLARLEREDRAMAVVNLALENLLLVNAISFVVGGFVLWLVYRSRRPTLVEAIVVSAYVGAQTMWLNAIFAVMLLPGPAVVLPVAVVGGGLMLGYTLWAWGAYFGGRPRDYLLAIVTMVATQCVLGVIAFAALTASGIRP
jgi:hypothetical protein